MKTRVLIVDDEPLARDVIRHWLTDKPGVEICGECVGGREALDFLRTHDVDLLFLDVQMPEMDGFALLAQLQIDAMPVVVFVTAHSRFAIQAFEAHAVGYLLKPFDQERFDRAFMRASQAVADARAGRVNRELRALLESIQAGEIPKREPAPEIPTRHLERLTARDGGKIVFVKTTDLSWLCAEGDYVVLHTGTRRYLVHETLTRLNEQLDPRQFVRIHRSVIVNLERIREMEPYFNGEYHVVMQDGTRLKLSRTYRQNLLAALGTESL